MSDRLAILIGNGRFDRDPTLARLLGPGEDVSSLGALLSDPQAGNFVVFEFRDHERRTLQAELERAFALGHAGSTVVFYYAGYVVPDPGRGLFLATADTELADLKGTAIPISSIKGLIRSCRSRSVVVVLDCCYISPSGGVDEVDIEQQLRRIRTDVGPDVHVIASPATSAAPESRESDTGAGRVAGCLTHAIVEGLATGAADRDGDNRAGVRDLNEYLGMRLQERRPLWSGPLEGADPELVVNPNPIEGVDLDAFSAAEKTPRRLPRRLVGAGLLAVVAAAVWTGYTWTRGGREPGVVVLRHAVEGAVLSESVGLVDDLDRLRVMVGRFGWIEHIEPLDGRGRRYAGAVALRMHPDAELNVDTVGLTLGLLQWLELDFGAGVHGFGVSCVAGVNTGEVEVELVDGRRYRFDVRMESEGGGFVGFLARTPVRQARIRSTSLRFAAESVFVYATGEFGPAEPASEGAFRGGS